MSAQSYYSHIIARGRRANPTYAEAQRDLVKVQQLIAARTFV